MSFVGLQEQIDEIIKNYEGSRTFVRPSGTEDLLRIFVEAPTREIIDEIGGKVEEVVLAHPVIKAGGK